MPAGHEHLTSATAVSKSAHHANHKSTSFTSIAMATPTSIVMSAPTPIMMSTPTPIMIVSTTTIVVSPSVVSSSIPSPTLIPAIQPEPSKPSSSSKGPIIGGVISGLLLLSSLLFCLLYRRLLKKKRQRMAIGHEDPSYLSKSWSTATMEAPPPAYYSSKRWTQDSSTSKPASFVKQYSPQLAYSPSDHSILRENGISPSHTLVDNSGWLHQKDDLNLPTEQQRRSIQPYQAQLNISSDSFSDALEPPYPTGILLHTPP